jgi:hypothetical protein
MDRTDFQTLSRVRLREAKALLEAGLCDGAYYLAGHAVECALKACILVRQASIQTDHKALAESDEDFNENWGIVKKWSEGSRYQTHTLEAAKALVQAIEDRKHGIIPWIRRYW